MSLPTLCSLEIGNDFLYPCGEVKKIFKNTTKIMEFCFFSFLSEVWKSIKCPLFAKCTRRKRKTFHVLRSPFPYVCLQITTTTIRRWEMKYHIVRLQITNNHWKFTSTGAWIFKAIATQWRRCLQYRWRCCRWVFFNFGRTIWRKNQHKCSSVVGWLVGDDLVVSHHQHQATTTTTTITIQSAQLRKQNNG